MATRLPVSLLVLALLVVGSGWLVLARTHRTSASSALGDANCDATVNTVDAALVLYYEAGLEDLPCSQNADVTGDQRVDSKDAAMILQYVAGLWSTNVLSFCPPQGCPISTPCPPGGCPTSTPTSTSTPCPSDGCPANTPVRTPCSPQGCPPRTPWPTPLPPQLGAAFSIAIDVDGDGLDDCTTHAGGSDTCALIFGEAVTLRVSLDELPAPLTGPQDGYEGYDIGLEFSGMALSGSPDAHAWPDCGFDAFHSKPGSLHVACAVGVQPMGAEVIPSSYTGVIVTAPVSCSIAGEISLLHGRHETYIVDDQFIEYEEASSGQETLHISCGTP